MAIIVAILGLNLLVVVHEFGHYLVARACGMRVLRFSIGFGPAIVSVQRGECVWQLAAFPVGGFVQVAGWGSHADDHEPGSYLSRPLWQRALMVLAGPGFNFAFAALVYIYLLGSSNALLFEGGARGTTVPRAVAGAAAKAGLRPFDVIESVDGVKVHFFGELKRAVSKSAGEPMKLRVARSPDGQRPPWTRRDMGEGLVFLYPEAPESWKRETIEVRAERTKKGLQLGVTPDLARYGATGSMIVYHATAESLRACGLILHKLNEALWGREELQVASVVKITEVTADSVKVGSDWFLTLLALLSVNLALLNLLPLPALDGGRLLFVAMEAIARRPVPRRVENLIHAVGMLVLLGLIAVVMAKEILELVQGAS